MERETGEDRLRAVVRRWRDGGARKGDGVGLGPGTAYEAVTRQMVEDLAREIGEIKGRLNGRLFMAAGAIVVDVALRLSGV